MLLLARYVYEQRESWLLNHLFPVSDIKIKWIQHGRLGKRGLMSMEFPILNELIDRELFTIHAVVFVFRQKECLNITRPLAFTFYWLADTINIWNIFLWLFNMSNKNKEE